MTGAQILLLVSLSAHLLVASWAIFKTFKATAFTKNQKQLNICLILLLPFIWSIFIYFILKKEPNYFDKRKHITNDNLESAGQIITLPSDHHFSS
jgi:hypothetical protein